MTVIEREERIGNCWLIQGNCLDVIPTIEPAHHFIGDPPYEAFMHVAKAQHVRDIRKDGRNEPVPLDFASIEGVREPFVMLAQEKCQGWFIAFCTPEGVGRWADAINASSMKYKRASFWHKRDGAPQFNGQGPAAAGECFVAAWAGQGHSKWNAGGKRGYYCHNTNSRNRDGRHPTEKPVPLMSEILNDYTNEGETVLDGFMGSGTTGIACALNNRHFIGIEQKTEYFELAVERIRKAHEGDLFQPERQMGFDIARLAP